MSRRLKPASMAWRYLVAAALVAFALLPFLWIVATSFNEAKSLLGARAIPEHLTLGNYGDLLGSTSLSFGTWLLNSLKVSIVSTLLIVAVTCTSAYAFSRYRFRGKKALLMLIMVLNVFPGILAMIAVYSLMQQIGNYVPFLGLNTHGGLVLFYVASSMSINVLMVKSFIDTIPVELDESARIEGAGNWTVFRRIIFPLMRPMVITVAVLAFMTTYGDFIVANLLLKGNDSITVMVGIYQFTQQRFDTDWGVVAAGTVISSLPAVLVFFLAQKHILSGLTAGAVKE